MCRTLLEAETCSCYDLQAKRTTDFNDNERAVKISEPASILYFVSQDVTRLIGIRQFCK